MSETCRGHLWDKIIIKLFASSWYIFLTYYWHVLRRQLNKYINYQLKWHHTPENFNCPTQQLFISSPALTCTEKRCLFQPLMLLTIQSQVTVRLQTQHFSNSTDRLQCKEFKYKDNKWISAENSHFQLMMITVNFPLSQECMSALVNKQQLSLQ